MKRSVPTRDEFLAGVVAYDGNSDIYFQALRGVEACWGDPRKMADAIGLLLCDWHRDYYHWGKSDPTALASAIGDKFNLLDKFRCRTITTLSYADAPEIRQLFWPFHRATGRTNKRGSDASPVGSAKVYIYFVHISSLCGITTLQSFMAATATHSVTLSSTNT